MSWDDEDDSLLTEGSIRDLLHAPPPPSPSSGGRPSSLSEQQRAISMSPQMLKRRAFGRSNSFSIRNNEKQQQASKKSFSGGRHRRYSSADHYRIGTVMSSANSSSGNERTASRQRLWSSFSASSLPTSSSKSPQHLLVATSFPPATNNYTNSERIISTLNEEKEDRLNDNNMIMQHRSSSLPEVPEAEERNSFTKQRIQEITLVGTEIDEVSGPAVRSRSASFDDSVPYNFSDETNLPDPADIWPDAVEGGCDTNDEEHVEDETEQSSVQSVQEQISIMGLKLPAWCSRHSFCWRLSQISTFVAKRAPCFLCCPLPNETNRTVLGRLNILGFIFSIFQLILALSLVLILLDPASLDRELGSEKHYHHDVTSSEMRVIVRIWSVNGYVFFLGTCSFVVLLAILFTIKAVRDVNLVGAIRYLWLLFWIIPLETFCAIGLFDYFQITKVWIKFTWTDSPMEWFRYRFCNPQHTFDTLCAVPVYADKQDEMDWCMKEWNSTECVDIRNTAQSDAELFLTRFYTLNAVVALFFVVLLILIVSTLESMISRPLVLKARESNLPAWLFLPMVGTGAVGWFYCFSSSSAFNLNTEQMEYLWVGPLYLVASGFFLVATILGWFVRSFSILTTFDKQRKAIAVVLFMCVSVLLMSLLVTIFVGSILLSSSLVDLRLSDEARGNFACSVDVNGICTNCDQEKDRCPEWTSEVVTQVLQSQAKDSAALAALFLLCTAGMFQFGVNLYKHNRAYQIDYV